MLNRNNIRNAAILHPRFCKEVRRYGKHAYAKTKYGSEQCIECGMIKTIKVKRYDNGLYKPTTN